jgi:PHD/YefM family antitoxin component YafN of YafNO toxin-antitoxin module
MGLATNEGYRHAHPFLAAAPLALSGEAWVIDKLQRQLYSSIKRTGEFNSMPRTVRNPTIVVSALHARTNFGKLLRQIEENRRSLVIEKRGTPRAILLSIRNYVRLAAPEPEILKVIGEESRSKGTDTLSSLQIDRVIKTARAKKSKR